MTRRLWRIGRALLLFVLLAITAVSSFGYWLATTSEGAHWLLNTANKHLPVTIKAASMNGSLLEGLSSSEITIAAKQTGLGFESLHVSQFAFRWTAKELLKGMLSLDSVIAGALDVKLEATPQTPKPQTSLVLPAIELPLSISVNQLAVNNIKIIRSETVIAAIPQVEASVKLIRNRLFVDTTHVRFQNEDYNLTAALTMAEAWSAKLTVPSHGLSGEGICESSPKFVCDASIQWQNLRHEWLGEVELPDGELTLDYRANTVAVVAASRVKFREIDLQVSAQTLTDIGESSTLFEQLKIAPASGGQMALSGRIDWGDTLTVDADLSLAKLNFNHWLPNPQPQATLSGTAKTKLTLTNGNTTIKTGFNVTELDFGREPLKGEIIGEFQDNKITFSKFDLANSYNSITAQGFYALQTNELGLELAVDANDFKRVSAEFAGDASLKASVSGNLMSPNLVMSAEASQVNVENLSIGNLQLKLDVHNIPVRTLEKTELDEFALKLTAFQYDDLILDTLEFYGKGSAAAHTVRLSAKNLFNRLSISKFSLEGGLTQQGNGSTSLTLENTTWNFNLNEFAISLANSQESWQLSDPSAFSLAASDMSVKNFCLKQHSAHACLSRVSFKDLKSLTAEGNLSGLFVDRERALFKDYYQQLPSTWHPQGELKGKLNLNANLDKTFKPISFSLDSVFRIEDSALIYDPGDEDPTNYSIDDAYLQLSGDEQLLAIDGGAIIGNDQKLLITGQIKQALAKQPDISVAARGKLHTLAYIQPFITTVTDLRGEATIDLRYLKNRTEPDALVLGSIAIKDAGFLVPASGGRVEQWQLNLQATKDAIDLSGNGLIGKGRLTVDGSVQSVATGTFPFKASIDLRGQNLQLVDLPDASFNASPELNLTGENLDWNLAGKLRISDSFIRLRELPKSASGISDDAVIYSDQPIEQKSPLNFTSNIDIIAGNNIRFEGFGLRTSIAGQLNFMRDNRARNQVHGALTLPDGEFKSYGQDLEIEDGYINFTGSPSNPTLDVRAARFIDNVKAGIWLHGTAKHPKTQLYSSPAMSEGDILSYLFTGKSLVDQAQRDSSQAQSAAVTMGLSQALQKIGGEIGLSEFSIESDFANGGGSIAAGKRVNDRLYVKYQYGLVGAVGRFIVEYSLTDSLTIEAGSGEIDTVDITYTWDSKPPKIDDKPTQSPHQSDQ